MTNIELRIKQLQDARADLLKEKGELIDVYQRLEQRPKWFFWLFWTNKYEVLNTTQMQIRSIQDFIEDVNRNLRFLHRAKAATDESAINGHWKLKH